jgi:hypothetical protein
MKLHTLTTTDRIFLPKLQPYLISLSTHQFTFQATELCKLYVPLNKTCSTKDALFILNVT